MAALDKRKLYRLPWSLYDNPIGWVEITDKCNMDCLGCYRNYLDTSEGHKPMDAVKKEILFMKEVRNAGEITLAGGEPLLHPELVDIVKFISAQSLGAKLFSNGKGLSKHLLHELVSAGMGQITLHIDSYQTRGDGWDNRGEAELAELRQHYLDISKPLKNLDLSFACMITRRNLDDIPDLIRWCLSKKGQVGGLGLFALRQYETVFNDGEPALVSVNKQDNVDTEDIYQTIRKAFPQYDAAAYFGGTADPGSFKWLFSASLCSPSAVVGSVGARSMELYQIIKHLKHGRYIGGESRESIIESALTRMLMFIFDRRVRGILSSLLKKPVLLLDRLYLFRIIIVQAHDISAFGDMDMCDGCPDMTYFKGRLVSSCRLDEYRKYGALIPDLRDAFGN
jgi:hypothetical protein